MYLFRGIVSYHLVLFEMFQNAGLYLTSSTGVTPREVRGGFTTYVVIFDSFMLLTQRIPAKSGVPEVASASHLRLIHENPQTSYSITTEVCVLCILM